MRKKRIEYFVASDRTPTRLAQKVNVLLTEGWTVQGGVAIMAVDDCDVWAQALVKVHEDEHPDHYEHIRTKVKEVHT